MLSYHLFSTWDFDVLKFKDVNTTYWHACHFKTCPAILMHKFVCFVIFQSDLINGVNVETTFSLFAKTKKWNCS